MWTELPSKLVITTSMSRAINIFPLVQGDISRYGDSRDEFIKDFAVQFNAPWNGKASFIDSQMAPRSHWFLIFEESEKAVNEDDFAFYGMMYTTTVRAALKRLRSHLRDLEAKSNLESHNNKPFNSEMHKEMMLITMDRIKAMQKGLRVFMDSDEIRLEFLFSEWPDQEEMKSKQYVKDFEQKLKAIRENCSNFPY